MMTQRLILLTILTLMVTSCRLVQGNQQQQQKQQQQQQQKVINSSPNVQGRISPKYYMRQASPPENTGLLDIVNRVKDFTKGILQSVGFNALELATIKSMTVTMQQSKANDECLIFEASNEKCVVNFAFTRPSAVAEKFTTFFLSLLGNSDMVDSVKKLLYSRCICPNFKVQQTCPGFLVKTETMLKVACNILKL